LCAKLARVCQLWIFPLRRHSCWWVGRRCEDCWLIRFVPEGLSLWELSVETGVGAKGDADFDKRLDTPDGSPTTDATCCALFPRRWRDRHDRAKTKSEVKRWKEVRTYGIDALEAWLENAPVTPCMDLRTVWTEPPWHADGRRLVEGLVVGD
jgi:hypothetical protein